MKNNKPVASILKSFLSTFASVFLTVIAIGFIIYIIWQRISIDNMNRELDTLKLQKKELKNKILHVNKEIDELTRFPRISKLAKDRMNLIESKKIPYLIVVNKFKYEADLANLENKSVSKQYEKLRNDRKVSKAGF